MKQHNRTHVARRIAALATSVAFVASAGWSVAIAADDATTVPFASLLEDARKGPALAEAEARIEAAGADADIAHAALMPQVGAGVRYGQTARDTGFNVPAGAIYNPVPLELVVAERGVGAARIQVEQLLWDGGRAHRALAAARLGIEAATLQREAATELVSYRLVAAVALWDRARGLHAAAQATVEEKQELVRQVQALVAQEQVPEADLMQAQAAMALAQVEAASAASELARSRAAVERLTGRSLPGNAAPGWPDLPPLPGGTVDAVATAAAARRPAPAALAKAAAAQDEAARSARAARAPQVALEGRADYIDDRYQLNRGNAEIAVVAKVPVFTGGRIGAAAARRSADARALAAAAEDARRAVREQVTVAFAEDEASAARLSAAEAADKAAREALRMAHIRYREDLVTARDLLGAEDDAAHAREALATARSARNAARLAARLAAGEPLF